MIIKEVHLNNFRVYYGENSINLEPDDRNVIIISGLNGYGKTTFLMAIVWCLFGEQMEEIDVLYKKEVTAQGNFTQYIVNCLNKAAQRNAKNEFSVSVTLSDLLISDLPCSELKIKRTYNTTAAKSVLQIFIKDENGESELGQEYSYENIIRKYILPKEIAKFFLFDAEKIESFIEFESKDYNERLTKAYSEVLGIKKFEVLKDELLIYSKNLKKQSASVEDKKELNIIEADIKNLEADIEEIRRKIEYTENTIKQKKNELKGYQDKLIEAGKFISEGELKSLREEENVLNNEVDSLNEKFGDFLNLIPLVIAANNLYNLSVQLEEENAAQKKAMKLENLEEKIELLLTELLDMRDTFEGTIQHKIHQFYSDNVRKLIKKYFNEEKLSKEIEILHNYSQYEYSEFINDIQNLHEKFDQDFNNILNEFDSSNYKLSKVRKKISDAEAKQKDELTNEIREKQFETADQIERLQREIGQNETLLGNKSNEKNSKTKEREKLTRKLEISKSLSMKYKKSENLIKIISEFIENLKLEKKKSLEENILISLNQILHEERFVDRVEVDLESGFTDVKLYNEDGKIDKRLLSKGQQQIFANSLLMALVKESNIEFPVFIDSPLQKLDEKHVENILKYFYPNLSKQVIIFPLLNSELYYDKYKILIQNIAKTFLIQKTERDKSQLIEIDPDNYFKKYNELYNENQY